MLVYLQNKPFPIIMAALALLVLQTSNGWAFFDQVRSTRDNGAGCSYISVPEEEAIPVNPAISLFTKTKASGVFDMGLLMLGLNHSKDELNSWNAGVSYRIDDTQAAGVQFNRLSFTSVYSENTFSAFYARKVLPKTGVYGRLKYLNKKYIEDEYTKIDPVFINNGYMKSAMTVDLGAVYSNEYYGAGVSILNITRPNMGLQDESIVPITVILGGHYYPSWRDSMLSAAFTKKEKTSEMGIGAEKWLSSKKLGLRIGTQFGDNNLFGITSGVSINIEDTRINYSINWPLSGVENTYGNQWIGLTLKF